MIVGQAPSQHPHKPSRRTSKQPPLPSAAQLPSDPSNAAQRHAHVHPPHTPGTLVAPFAAVPADPSSAQLGGHSTPHDRKHRPADPSADPFYRSPQSAPLATVYAQPGGHIRGGGDGARQQGGGGGGGGGQVDRRGVAKSARLLGAEEADVFEYIHSRASATAGSANVHGHTSSTSNTAMADTGAATGTFGRLARKVSKRSIHPIVNAPGTTGISQTGGYPLGTSVNASQAYLAPSSSARQPLPREAADAQAQGKGRGYQRQLDRFEALVNLSENRNVGATTSSLRASGMMQAVRGGSGPSMLSAVGGVHSGGGRESGTGLKPGKEAGGKAYRRQSKSVHPLFATVSPGDGTFLSHPPSSGEDCITMNRAKRSTSDPVSPDPPYTTLPDRNVKYSSQHALSHTHGAGSQTPRTRPSLPAPPRNSSSAFDLHPIIPPTTPQRGSNDAQTASGATKNPPSTCSPNTRRLKAEKEWRARVQALSAGVRAGRERASPYPQRSSVILLNEDMAGSAAIDGALRGHSGAGNVYKGPLPPRAPRRRQMPFPTPALSGAGTGKGLGLGLGSASTATKQDQGLATSFGSTSTQSGISSLGESSGTSGASDASKGSGLTFATATSASALTTLSIPSLSLSLSPASASVRNGQPHTAGHSCSTDLQVPSTPATPAHLVPSTPMSARWDITLNLSPPSSVLGGGRGSSVNATPVMTSQRSDLPPTGSSDRLGVQDGNKGGQKEDEVPISAVGTAAGPPLTPCSPLGAYPLPPLQSEPTSGADNARGSVPRTVSASLPNRSPLPTLTPMQSSGPGSAARSRRYKDLPYTSPGKIALSARSRSRTSSAAGSVSVSVSAVSRLENGIVSRSPPQLHLRSARPSAGDPSQEGDMGEIKRTPVDRLTSLGSLGLGSPTKSTQKTGDGDAAQGKSSGVKRDISAESDFSMLSVPLTGVSGISLTGLTEVTGDSRSILLLDALAGSPSPPARDHVNASTRDLNSISTGPPVSPLAGMKRSTAPGILSGSKAAVLVNGGTNGKEASEYTRPISFAGSTFFSSTAPLPAPPTFGRGKYTRDGKIEPNSFREAHAGGSSGSQKAPSTAFYSSAYTSSGWSGLDDASVGRSPGVNYGKLRALPSGAVLEESGPRKACVEKGVNKGLGFSGVKLETRGQITRALGVDLGAVGGRTGLGHDGVRNSGAGGSDEESTRATAWVEGSEDEVELGQARVGVRVGTEGGGGGSTASQGAGKRHSSVDVLVTPVRGTATVTRSSTNLSPTARADEETPILVRTLRNYTSTPLASPNANNIDTFSPTTGVSTRAHAKYAFRASPGVSTPDDGTADEPLTPRPSTRTQSRQQQYALAYDQPGVGEAHSPMTRYILTASALSNHSDMGSPERGNGRVSKQGAANGYALRPLHPMGRHGAAGQDHDDCMLVKEDKKDRDRSKTRQTAARGDDRGDHDERHRHPFARGGVAHSPVKTTPVHPPAALTIRQGDLDAVKCGSARTAIAITPVPAPAPAPVPIHTAEPLSTSQSVDGLSRDMQKLSVRSGNVKPPIRPSVAKSSPRLHALAHTSASKSHKDSIAGMKRQIIGGRPGIASHAGQRLTEDAMERRRADQAMDGDRGALEQTGAYGMGREGRRPPKSGMDRSDLARWLQSSAAPAADC